MPKEEQKHEGHERTVSGINVLAGIWLIISPFIFGYNTIVGDLWNNVIVGAVVSILALIRIATPRQAEFLSWVNFILGLWMIASPFILGYPTVSAQWANVIAGVIVAILSSRSVTETRMIRGRTATV
ncbi:SPW repeat protein [Patescibacteria group bacterium]|nr:SPW repeat protein [Patescibacteria group bacterium]